MKYSKKILSFFVAVLMFAGMITGCAFLNRQEIVGTWLSMQYEDKDYVLEVLTYFELYPEEIDLIDTDMQIAKIVEFREDNTYSFRYDSEVTKQSVRSYFDDLFHDLYEKREQVGVLYDMSFTLYSFEAFGDFYAQLYDCGDYENLLDTMAGEVYDYELLAEPYETGTFRVLSDRIYCTITGETQPEYIEYAFDGTNLTLLYQEAEEVYQKAQ